MSLHDFDAEAQNKISESSITIFGLGGLGSVCSLYLSNAGVGKMNLVDYDTVDETNLPRQIIYCLLYTSPSPRDRTRSRMPSSA